jgi:hypothetical protein
LFQSSCCLDRRVDRARRRAARRIRFNPPHRLTTI